MSSSCYYYPNFFFPLSFLTSFMASAQSPASSPPGIGKGGNYVAIIIAIGVPIGVVFLLFIIGFIAMRTRRGVDTTPAIDGDEFTIEDSLLLDFRTIQAATHNFSGSNKLGEGEFGEVYKGTFCDGVDIAVKRLSKSSGLSEVEFKNEVVLLSKLQHKNLVRFLGFCLEGEERLLVYECLPNKSLDFLLFGQFSVFYFGDMFLMALGDVLKRGFCADPAKKSQIDWTLRHKIIEGIARAMLYLHQDSQLRVIHCDLKASNILLDACMNPKVANVGMERLFGIEKKSREYEQDGCNLFAMRGQISMKYHVYSFGVLLLEIMSGKKNSCYYETEDGEHDLITYAWRLWRNGTPLDLVEPAISYNYQRSEVIRCIQIGLLCVQEDHFHLPMFSTIVMMLTSNTITLPEPQKPGFSLHRRPGRGLLDKYKSDETVFSFC